MMKRWSDAAVRWALVLLLTAVLFAAFCPPTQATVVTLKNGMTLEGVIGKIAGLTKDPLNPGVNAGQVQVTPIVFLDDDLRRVYVPSRQVASVAEGGGDRLEKIFIKQRTPRSGRVIGALGPILNVTPFDKYGRRTFSMQGPKGRMDMVQGITVITPRFAQVENLLGKDNYRLTMYVATSSLPRQTLSTILMRHVRKDNPDDRLRIVRLYIQAERFQDARLELERVIEDFPKLKDLKKQVNALNQLGARRLIDEIEKRRDAGQHQLAHRMLRGFPSDGVAGETLLRVREILGEYDKVLGQAKKVQTLLQDHLKAIKDEAVRRDVTPVVEEIRAKMNINTISRMADYLRLADDEKLNVQEKLALAISGWILGSGSATENMAVAADLLRVRTVVHKYLNSKLDHERTALLNELSSLEGSSPTFVAKVLANMMPPVISDEGQQDIPGFYEITTPGMQGHGDIKYYVQLPPEYDPNRRYPCVVTLHGAGTNAEQQIDWWAGGYSKRLGMRLGQATRQGYIVIAPQWAKERQRRYEFSAREHAAVLFALRDAMKRCSIDTDRVFLSGHSMGGDAAWDIGLAHPDLWAGVAPIVGTARRYVSRYWENGRKLPMYFVGGELDGKRLQTNSLDLDRYLTKAGYDITVVEYKGRGHEHFQDEVQNLFRWMNLHRRNFFPRQFKCVSMRPWDNYFWWVELDAFPSRSMVAPMAWPKPRARAAMTEARIIENNRILVNSAAQTVSVYLTPDMVDFERKVDVSVNRSRSKTKEISPDVKVMLEDARTRGDRQHPFWAKVTASRK